MPPSALSRSGWFAATLMAVAVAVGAASAQPLVREGNRWVQTISGTGPASARLRVTCQGPVHLEAGSGNDLSYTARLSVMARTEAEARRILAQVAVRAVPAGE